MERSYEKLKTSDNRAQALREAMLQTMDVHEGSGLGCFTLVGTVAPRLIQEDQVSRIDVHGSRPSALDVAAACSQCRVRWL